jgi:aspartyl-tRNA(Asn)/glutamyl-tRNA(Gln) amidotransferase subunit C
MLSKDDVLGVSKLSRLKLSDEQVDKFKTQMENVLELFDEVKNIDVDGIEETSQVSGLKNITREDVVEYDDDLRPDSSNDLLVNTPRRDGSKIIVPKVIDTK